MAYWQNERIFLRDIKKKSIPEWLRLHLIRRYGYSKYYQKDSKTFVDIDKDFQKLMRERFCRSANCLILELVFILDTAPMVG